MKFMLDIETTGVGHSNEVLEVALLQLNWNGQFYETGNRLDLFIPRDVEPINDFAKEHMTWLYEYCTSLERMYGSPPAPQVRQEILEFFDACGAKDRWDRIICGWNVSTFDLPFLERAGFLKSEDIHYRVVEMSGMTFGLMDSFNDQDREKLFATADQHDPADTKMPTADMCPGDISPNKLEHWGLYDCYLQTRRLNGYIRLMRMGTNSII